jgi:hypothetical protein
MSKKVTMKAKKVTKSVTKKAQPKKKVVAKKEKEITTDKNIKFELSIPQFEELIAQDCTYCGINNSNGLDKVDPKGHYVMNNVVPCCTKCNMMKFTLNTIDFLNHVERIHKFNNP